MTDDDQLRDLFARMCRAWSEGDARAYGDCFTADCAYVAFDGSRVEGRAAVVAGHDKLFRDRLIRAPGSEQAQDFFFARGEQIEVGVLSVEC